MELQGFDRYLFMFPIELAYNRFQRRHFLLRCISRFKSRSLTVSVKPGDGRFCRCAKSAVKLYKVLIKNNHLINVIVLLSCNI